MINAPTSLDFVDHLIDERSRAVASIDRMAEYMASDDAAWALSLYEKAQYALSNGRDRTVRPEFAPERAYKALDAAMWNRAINTIGVRDFFPAERRNEWAENIAALNVPEFTEENARATLRSLLDSRMDFLAEMVDGIFRGLSREHVTNRPEGFSKRFILPYLNPVSFYQSKDVDHLHDLRGVIAKFMGWPVPEHGSTRALIQQMKRFTGDWFDMDAGTLKVRVYKKGTGHVEVHPSISRRLNQVLAHLYPNAIPSQFREVVKNKRAKPEPTLFDNPIPAEVLEVLRRDVDDRGRTVHMSNHHGRDKHVKGRIADILEAIGGVQQTPGEWLFDFDPQEVIAHIRVSGALPDEKSHQYYPTPEWLAMRAVDMAQITDADVCVEPQAGQGAIAAHMPARTVCMDISPLHVEILRAKGHLAQEGDCLKTRWNADVVVMNPPYSQKRWKTHTEHMLSCLNNGGRLVAILPTTAITGIVPPPGVQMTRSEEHKRPFPGVSIDIALILWEKQETRK